ncbi:MAG: hypothetical protein N0C84_00995 [Candidatus Thiodiazotropha taylori]|uniref:Uncharacterized protein n=1 Tax=Candidatus Thiodiazotropha taylori TaxID=2792791 RepID=A0A9E4N1Q4_9GAMM|nr:hypothetical protein [Candidatus Thiodiazotropha taylori]MCW4255022.1 hypothetical protein [Candidatus Thiodiazotropha taylori]
MNYVSIYQKSDNYIPGEFALCGGNTLRTAIELCDYRLTEEDIQEYMDIFNRNGIVYVVNGQYYDETKVKNTAATFMIVSKEKEAEMEETGAL